MSIDVAQAVPVRGRPLEVELWSNRWIIHPMARRLAIWLARTPATPNMVSCFGVLAPLCAALAYTGLQPPVSVALGFLCHASWHVFDGADGELARRTGRASPTGELVDGVCDYTGQAILYVALAWMLSHSIGPWAWPLAALSGAARAVQANSYESRRRIYRYWGYGGGWIRQSLAEPQQDQPKGWLAKLGRAYLAISDRVARPAAIMEQAMAVRVARGGRLETYARGVFRCCQVEALKVSKPLSANARTVALGVAMAFGSPLWFFIYETVVLTALLLWSIRVHREADEVTTGFLLNPPRTTGL